MEDDLFARFSLHKRLPASIRNRRIEDPITSPLIRREIIHGQRRIEGQNFEIRKTLWDYAYLTEKQRSLLGELRRSVLLGQRRIAARSKPQREALRRWESDKLFICRL